MTRMFAEAHKSLSSISTLLLLCTLFMGGYCEETSSKETESLSDHPAPEVHARVSRSASSPGEDSSSSGRFLPPLTLNRYQGMDRVSRFHGPKFVGGGLGYHGGRPVTSMLVNRDAPDGESQHHQPMQQHEGTHLGEQDPTFTPFISASALGNMPQFWDYLKANLQALNKDEGEVDSSELDEEFELGLDGDGMPASYPEHKGLIGGSGRWAPAAFGVPRQNIRNFVQDYRTHNGYHPSRNVYEFGLG